MIQSQVRARGVQEVCGNYMSPKELASWISELFESIGKPVDTVNIERLQVNGYTLTWASASQIAEMMGHGATVKVADFVQRKLRQYQKEHAGMAMPASVNHRPPSLSPLSIQTSPKSEKGDKLPPPDAFLLNNLRFISDQDNGELIFKGIVEKEKSPFYDMFRENPDRISFDTIWSRAFAQAETQAASEDAKKTGTETPPTTPLVCIGDIFHAAGQLTHEAAMYDTWMNEFIQEEKIVPSLKSKRYQSKLILEATKDNTVDLTKEGLEQACLDKTKRQCDKVCNELISTERDFVAGLQRTVDVYARELQPILSPQDYRKIFTPLETLKNVHKRFLNRMREDRENFLDAFQLLMPHFTTHSDYTANYSTVQHLVVELKKTKQFNDIVAKCDSSGATPGGLDHRFDSLLQQPITRITRYELLLKDIAKWMIPEFVDLRIPLDEHTDVRTSMKFLQQFNEDATTRTATPPSSPKKKRHSLVVIGKLIGDKSTGKKGLAEECKFKPGDTIFSINGVIVAGVLELNDVLHEFKQAARSGNKMVKVVVKRSSVRTALAGVHAVALMVNRGIANMAMKKTLEASMQYLPLNKAREKHVEWIFKDSLVEAHLSTNLPDGGNGLEALTAKCKKKEKKNKAAAFTSPKHRKLVNLDMLAVFSDSLFIANSRVPGCGIVLPLPLSNITREMPFHARVSSSPRPSSEGNRETATIKFRYTAAKCLKHFRNHFNTESVVSEDINCKNSIPSRFNDTVYTWPFSTSKHGTSSVRWTYKDSSRVERQYAPQVQFTIEAALGRGEAKCKIYPKVAISFSDSREEDTSQGHKNTTYREVLRNGKRVTAAVINNAMIKYETRRQVDELTVTVALTMEKNELQQLFEQLTDKINLIHEGRPYMNYYNMMLRLPASNELLQRMWLDRTNSSDRSKRRKFFQDVLGIYQFRFLTGNGVTPAGVTPHEEFVRSMFCDKEKFRVLREQTFVLTSRQYNPKLIQSSLVLRYPIYFGIPALMDFGLRSNFYYKDRVVKALGYDLLTRPVPDGLESVRYVIAGRVAINPGINKRKLKNVCVVHAWGCNFEKRTTWDYHHIQKTSASDTKFQQLYQSKTLEMFRMICEAADRLGCKTIRMPAIGAGQYTNALPNKRKRFVDRDFLKCLAQAQKEYPHMKISRRFPFNASDPKTNLFQTIKKDNVCLVNAWDSRSFIGNGGSEDKTIDGWMVTGIDNSPSSGNNTAYLQNVFFMPEMVSPENWKFLKSEEKVDIGRGGGVAAVFVWDNRDNNGDFGHEIFEDTAQATKAFHARHGRYQCAAVFSFSIAKEHHNIIVQHKRKRTVLEKLQGKVKLIESLIAYFESHVVPAYAKQLREKNPTQKSAPAASASAGNKF